MVLSLFFFWCVINVNFHVYTAMHNFSNAVSHAAAIASDFCELYTYNGSLLVHKSNKTSTRASIVDKCFPVEAQS